MKKILEAVVLLCLLLVPASVAAFDWPARIESGDTVITVYMPQIETFEGDMLTARAAVSISVPDLDAPVFGAVWFEAYALTDRGKRTVVLSDIGIIETRFPSVEGKRSDRYRELASSEIDDWEFLITLDDLEAALHYVDLQKGAVKGLRNDPPKIYFRTVPAVLVLIDGDPKETKLEDSNLKYVVNTAFFIVHDDGSRLYYLRGGPWWYASKKVDSGYAPVDAVPPDVEKLAEAADRAAAEAADGEEAADADSVFSGKSPPEVIISTEPAELIVSEGEPEYAPIEGTDLLYMTNTDDDVLMDTKNQRYYILVSGRWFTASSMDGGWKFVPPDKLPEDFAKIPPDSENGHLLASVAGTEEARDAVLDQYIPQTAEVDRREATVSVEYDGKPKFEKIEDTDLSYAVNTEDAVIKAGDRYYCCDEAVWFESGSPTGPWEVCVEVPDAVYTIPPSCPIYNVVYVHVYDYTPDVVYTGYTPGYTCSYVYSGTVIYGTGWHYRPWYGHYYYPRPVTWGFGVHWNPYTGWGFSFGLRFGGPYGWFRIGWGAPVGYWGPRGYWAGYGRGYRHGYYHGAGRGLAVGYRAGQRQPRSRNLYRNRENGVRRTGEVRTMDGKKPSAGGGPSTMDRKRPAGTRDDMYAGKDGNVYRAGKDGWEKQGGAKTRDTVRRPDEAVTRDLERHRAARDKGARSSEAYKRETRPQPSGGKTTRQSTGGRNTRPRTTPQGGARPSGGRRPSTNRAVRRRPAGAGRGGRRR